MEASDSGIIKQRKQQWTDLVFPIVQKEARIFCYRCGCPDQAGDITNETFIALWKADRIDFGNPGWKSFIKQTTRRVASHYLEKKCPPQVSNDALPNIEASDTPLIPPLNFPPPDAIPPDLLDWADAYWQDQEKREQLLDSYLDQLHRDHHPIDPDTHHREAEAILAAHARYLSAGELAKGIIFKHWMEHKGFAVIAAELGITPENATQIHHRDFIVPLRKALGA